MVRPDASAPWCPLGRWLRVQAGERSPEQSECEMTQNALPVWLWLVQTGRAFCDISPYRRRNCKRIQLFFLALQKHPVNRRKQGRNEPHIHRIIMHHHGHLAFPRKGAGDNACHGSSSPMSERPATRRSDWYRCSKREGFFAQHSQGVGQKNPREHAPEVRMERGPGRRHIPRRWP